MTDDEISELAEYLWSECARSDRPIVPDDQDVDDGCCPLGASLPRFSGSWRGPGYPTEAVASVRLGISTEDALSFITGFGSDAPTQNELESLGRRFREQALSGDGFR